MPHNAVFTAMRVATPIAVAAASDDNSDTSKWQGWLRLGEKSAPWMTIPADL